MKKINLLIGGVSAGLTSLMWSGYAFAANNSVDLCNSNQGGVDVKGFCTKDIGSVIGTVINLFLFIAFVAALIYLIYGGIRWIMSGGDKEATGKAKATVTAALIGLAVVLGSWILINIILTFFGGNGIGGLVFPSL